MSQFASFYLTKTSEFWGPTESHTGIIQHHGLTEDGVRGPNGERVELVPPDGDLKCSDLSKWVYILDQDIHTDWHLEDPGKTEERARAALARRANSEKWFVTAECQAEVAGYASTLTGGDDSTLTGGNRSTLTGGDASTLTGGYASTLTGGNRSTLTGGNRSTLTGGYASTLTGGNASTLTGGNASTLTGGYDSTLTGGDASTLTGGDDSTLTGGDASVFIIRWYDYDTGRKKFVVAQVDGSTILPNVPYCVSNGVFTRKDS